MYDIIININHVCLGEVSWGKSPPPPPRMKDPNQLRLDMITVSAKSVKMSEGIQRSCDETLKKSWPITNTQDLLN